MTTGKTLDVTVAGIAIRLDFDRDGRPLGATHVDRPGDDQGLVELAVQKAFETAMHAFQATQHKRSSVVAAAVSAHKRAKASADHWTNAFFERAHAAHPNYGKDRLAQLARSLAAKKDDEAVKANKPHHRIPAEKRAEITVERARQFLERKRNAPL